LINTSYDDGLTSTKYFWYDTSPGWLLWSVTPSNTIGRLAATQTNYGADNRAQYGYDSMGNVAYLWQCAPSICGTSHQEDRTLAFSYNALGDLTDESDPTSGHIVYGRTPAGEISSITNLTYADAYNPGSVMTNIVNGPFGPVTYTLGNGLNVFRAYDGLGRNWGSWVCSGTPQLNCPTQVYGWANSLLGSRVTGLCDTVIGQCQGHGYDEFNRLTSISGSNNNYTYTYDRYGNRTQQTSSPSGPAPSYSFDQTKNQVIGMSYDAAGNLAVDGAYSYSYDAEGNVLNVNNGTVATYGYDAVNHRISAPLNGNAEEYIYDAFGRRTSSWITSIPGFGNQGRIYSDNAQISYRAWNGTMYFDHQDYLGTERVHTNYLGQLAVTDHSLAFGDGYGQGNLISGDGTYGATMDNLQFAGLDYDSESNTDHAMFRQYSPTQGRWMSPDPYDGSMDFGNPQSLNRYTYVNNMPLSMTDPSGLGPCGIGKGQDGQIGVQSDDALASCVEGLFSNILSHLIHPSFHGTTTSRPIWDEHSGYTPHASLADLLGLPSSGGCEFGACGSSFGAGGGLGGPPSCGADNKDVCGPNPGYYIGLFWDAAKQTAGDFRNSLKLGSRPCIAQGDAARSQVPQIGVFDKNSVATGAIAAGIGSKAPGTGGAFGAGAGFAIGLTVAPFWQGLKGDWAYTQALAHCTFNHI
jgi:RHS repeat-associated protein